MALAGQKPKFEDNEAGAPAGSTVTTEAPKAPTQAAANDAKVPAVANAAAGAVMAGSAFKDVFKALDNKIAPVGFGTLERIIGATGAVMVKGNGSPDLDLGEKIDFTIISFHDEYVLSPGTEDQKGKEYVRYSLDGKTIEGTGESCDAYIERLKTVENFPKAEKKRYVHLIGTLDAAQKTPAGAPIGDMVDVSLSPNSVQKWENYRLQTSVKRSQAPADAQFPPAEKVSIFAVKKSGNGRNWVELHVKARQ